MVPKASPKVALTAGAKLFTLTCKVRIVEGLVSLASESPLFPLLIRWRRIALTDNCEQELVVASALKPNVNYIADVYDFRDGRNMEGIV